MTDRIIAIIAIVYSIIQKYSNDSGFTPCLPHSYWPKLVAKAKKHTSRDLKTISKLISHHIPRGPPYAYSEYPLCHFIQNVFSLIVHIQEMQ